VDRGEPTLAPQESHNRFRAIARRAAGGLLALAITVIPASKGPGEHGEAPLFPSDPAVVVMHEPEFQIPETPIYPEVDLDPITNPAWQTIAEEADANGTTARMGNARIRGDGNLNAWYRDLVPAAHQEAFDAMLEEPVVELAFESGNLEGFSLEAVPRDKDNGHFYPDTNEAALEIGAESILYLDQEMIRGVGIHEAVHSMTDDWYQHIRDNTRSDDTILNEKIDRVVQTCDTINNRIFADFITSNRSEVVNAYRLAAADFVNQALIEENDGDPANDDSIGSHQAYASSLNHAATSLERGDPGILVNFASSECAYTGPMGILRLIPGNDSDWLHQMNDYVWNNEGELISDLSGVNTTAWEDAKEAFDAVNDGRGYEDMFNKAEDTLNAGHAYDNSTEATSSLIEGLIINSSYMRESLNALPIAERLAMFEYIDALIDITRYSHPALYEIAIEDPTARSIIQTASAISNPRPRVQLV